MNIFFLFHSLLHNWCMHKYIHKKAFTNRVHGYDRAPNVHTNGITLHCIDWAQNWELCINWPHRLVCFKKLRPTTTTVFSFPLEQSWIFTAKVQYLILSLSYPYLNFKVNSRSVSVWYSNTLWPSHR